jgi:hypothetical protein
MKISKRHSRKSVLKESTIERNTYNDSIPAGMSQNHSKVAEKAPLEKRVGRVDERTITQLASKQHAQYKQITEIIIEITKITENAVKIRRNTKDFVEVEVKELERVVAKLRRVAEV